MCAECALPEKKVKNASSAVRPLGFNRCVAIDIKFLKNAEGVQFRALSMIDGGTSFHQAVFLKSLKPEHVWKKFLET